MVRSLIIACAIVGFSGSSYAQNQPCSGSVCVGDKVIDTKDKVGIVKALFGKGQVQVYYELGWDAAMVEVKNINELTRTASTDCLMGICRGNKVLYKDRNGQQVGTVIALFLNGKAQIYRSLGWDAAMIEVKDIQELTPSLSK
ncbi:MAG: hypothetical protein PHF00_00935 [Elusimicrobia bacterium]|nr:hypothetical protein [Elusimicrobiota bacterium]